MTLPLFNLFLATVTCGAGDLQLCDANPRYLQWNGKPTVLVTSGEHYGALLNLDFPSEPYLAELERAGLNLTRLFSGTYREVPGSFNISQNTLAPKPGRYQAPWRRVSQPGEPEKFDLESFDPDYFERLRAFLQAADSHHVIVEFVLFCPLYEEILWQASPLNSKNNIQGIGTCERNQVLALKDESLTRVQLAFTSEVVRQINPHRNVYFEVCNEPYFGGVTLDFQAKIAETIVATEQSLPNKHLIAQNIANDKGRVDHPIANIDIYNFHYATPPIAIAQNAHLNRPIADDETGFRGVADKPYRIEAWQFLTAGGAIVSNLDYSFTTDQPEGSAKVVDPTPGGGGASLRQSLGAAGRLVESLDLATTKPAPEILRDLASGTSAQTLADAHGHYLAHFATNASPLKFRAALPPGTYEATWINTRDGSVLRTDNIHTESAGAAFESPAFEDDIALRITRRP
jgi:hypothetical protein